MSEKESDKDLSVNPLTQEVAFEITCDMKYNPKCLCENTCCARHGNCRACMAFHKLTAHAPTCRYAWKKW